jgi:UDP-glucose 4-epimerase
MNVLVVGGAGYIGSHVVYELIKENHNVVVFDNLSSGYLDFIHPKAEFIAGDITSSADVNKALSLKKYDVVMHFAAKIVVPESIEFPDVYYQNNVYGTKVLLDGVKKYKVPHFIFSSSAAVYGEGNGVCSESDTLNPINPYGETKVVCENMIKWYSSYANFSYICFRYFNVAGADPSLKIGLKKDQITHLIPLAVQTLLGTRNELVIYGVDYPTPDGTCIRDYIHVSDLARAHVLGATYLVNGGQSDIFNLGSSTGYSVSEVVNATKKIGSLKYTYGSRRFGDPAMLIANVSKVQRVLNFNPIYDLNSMITSDIAYRQTLSKKR